MHCIMYVTAAITGTGTSTLTSHARGAATGTVAGALSSALKGTGSAALTGTKKMLKRRLLFKNPVQVYSKMELLN